jgi:hypothetical protein
LPLGTYVFLQKFQRLFFPSLFNNHHDLNCSASSHRFKKLFEQAYYSTCNTTISPSSTLFQTQHNSSSRCRTVVDHTAVEEEEAVDIQMEMGTDMIAILMALAATIPIGIKNTCV